ncbi:hypothetical protein MVEG_02995 [Podila verticillata NRRL 6337]|nr:hypothetical protein MVEG_02995 [Podila verticillata NRRL 6337]
MPLSNVFRNTFQNPFHGSRKGGRYGRAGSIGSLTSSSSSLPGTPGIVVVSIGDHKSHSSSIPSPSPMANSKPKNHKKIRISILNSNKENRDTAMAELALNKGKQRKDSKDSKESKKSRSSKSNSSSVSTCLLEQLGPTSMDMNLSDLPAKLAPFNDSLAQLQISRLHSSFYHDQDLASLTTLSTPTSDTFLPSPSSMYAPSTPSTPLSPAFYSSSPLSAEPQSMFAEGYENEERITDLPDLGSPPKQEPKRKRLSTGSMQLGQFLANTFKPKHRRSTTSGSSHATTVHPDLSTARKALLVTRANEVVTTPELADAKPPKQRKRRSLFAKLPKLDTRAPKIVISAPIKGEPKVPKITQDGGDPQELSDEQQSADESGSGSAPFVFTPALLSPFYLPNPPRSKTAIHGGSNSNQLGLPGGVAVDDNLEYNEKAAPPNLRVKEPQWTMDWRHDSRVYYDDRWDRASILTVDSEMIRLAEDPDFPEYPERNAYWEQHCQIRERRWKQQLQQYAQDKDDPTGRWMKNKAKAGAMTAVSEDSASLLAEEEDERAEDLDNDTQRNKRFHHVTMLLHTAANPAEAARAAAQQAQSRQRRTRYSSYSAYMAAMQLKSRNRTDRKRYSVDAIATSPPRDDLPRISPKLIEDVRALKERSLQQKAEQRPNYVKTITDRFEGVPDSDSDTSPVRNGVPVFPLVVQKQQSKFLSPLDASSSRRGMGINAGSSDDDDDEFSCRTPAQRIQADYQVSQEFPSPQRQQQPDSGILFVASTTTTVEVFPGLNHDPQAPLSNPRIGYIQSAVQSTGSTQDGGGLPALPLPHTISNDPSLSRPGQYASHNHIMPLDKLLRLQEEHMYRQKQQLVQQQPQNNTIYPDDTNPSSSARFADADTAASFSHPNNNNNNAIFNPNFANSISPSTALQQQCQQYFDTSPQPSITHHQQQPQQQDPNTQGHMLLMLNRGRYHYYKNGTRKREPEWDEDRNGDDTMEDAQMKSLGNQKRISRLFDDAMIEEGDEDADMKDTENADGESNKRKYSAIAQDSKGKDRFRSVACVATERQYLPLLDARDDGFLESMERMPSNDSFSSTEIDPLLQQALPPSPLSSGSKVASLGRIRGTKTRASVSYTAMPTMAQPATIPLCPSFTSASGSTLFLPSSSSSQMASHLLRHRASGSMTSGTLTGGMTTPTSMTSRSPTTRSWADLSQYPSSASMMLLDSLSSPMKVAYMLQPGSQRKTESQGGKKGGRSLSVSILSSALRKPIFGGGSDEVQSPRLPETEADPMMDHTGDEEADKEMEQELVDEVQGDVCGSPSNKVSKKRFRAMTMVELSVASPLQFKAEPSTSTSTMVTLHSEGRYQWNQFFDV